MMTSLRWTRFLIVCLLLAPLAGCAIAAAETPTPKPKAIATSRHAVAVIPEPTVTPIPFVEGTEFPTGRFVHENPRIWAFEFDEDGTWRGFEGDVDNPCISGKYATNGNLFTEMTHDYSASPKIPATYFWAYDGKNLTFQLWGEDVNSHRKGVYDGQTYIKSE